MKCHGSPAAVLDEVEHGGRRQARGADARARRRSSPAATCCSRTSPGSARRSPHGRSPRRSGWTSPAPSSPPTCCRPTSPARSSTTSAPASSSSGRGPLFTGLLLADEINRTPPKTQAALLEAMQERQVTVEGADVPAPDAVPRARHREPDRVRGHLPAARGPARPVPAAGRASATRPPTRSGTCCARRMARRREEQTLARSPTPADAARHAGGGRDGRPSTRASAATAWRWPTATRAHPHVLMGASPRGSLGLLLAARAYAGHRRPGLRHARGRQGGRRVRCSPIGSR